MTIRVPQEVYGGADQGAAGRRTTRATAQRWPIMRRSYGTFTVLGTRCTASSPVRRTGASALRRSNWRRVAILQEMILARLQKRFTGAPTEGELRSMIAYTMSLSWLILGALEEKYMPPDDGIDAADLLDF
jgi:hypothetical protein